jgi:hypothetical protein
MPHYLSYAVVTFVVLLVIWKLSTVQLFDFSNISESMKEKMTRIRRTVGVINEANETQVAPGVVNSVALMDYTHTYWDGDRVTSCDECPNPYVCPTCPQFGVNNVVNTVNTTTNRSKIDTFRIRGGGVSPRENVLDSNHEPNFTPTISVNESSELSKYQVNEFSSGGAEYNTEYFVTPYTPDEITTIADKSPKIFELDSGYSSSRERMGACNTRQYSNVRAAGFVSRNDYDYKLDEQSALYINNTRKSPSSEKNVLTTLYSDVMGIGNYKPAPTPCEYRGVNGYLYKEDCMEVGRKLTK